MGSNTHQKKATTFFKQNLIDRIDKPYSDKLNGLYL